tara:strand:+ start:113 stop:424 length:312 start_codon:yes stop_codon:yes gene_type:complete
MKKYLKYILLFLILKPIITVVGYPINYAESRLIDISKALDVYPGIKQAAEEFNESLNLNQLEDFNYHILNYFEYHNEAFAYSFAITFSVFLFFDKRSGKPAKM